MRKPQSDCGSSVGTAANPNSPTVLDVVFVSARERQNVEALRDLLYRRVRELHVQKYPYNDFLFQEYDAEGEAL